MQTVLYFMQAWHLGQVAQLSTQGKKVANVIVCLSFVVVLHMLLRLCCDAVP